MGYCQYKATMHINPQRTNSPQTSHQSVKPFQTTFELSLYLTFVASMIFKSDIYCQSPSVFPPLLTPLLWQTLVTFTSNSSPNLFPILLLQTLSCVFSLFVSWLEILRFLLFSCIASLELSQAHFPSM